MGHHQSLSGTWQSKERNTGLLNYQLETKGPTTGNGATAFGDQLGDLCQMLALSFSEPVQSTSNSRYVPCRNSRNARTEVLRELYQWAPLFARAHVTRILIPRSPGRREYTSLIQVSEHVLISSIELVSRMLERERFTVLTTSHLVLSAPVDSPWEQTLSSQNHQNENAAIHQHSTSLSYTFDGWEC
jgi:hypothetical protein